MLRLFVGYDKVESVAYHVFCESVISRCSMPISITPICLSHLGDCYSRARDPKQSTEFSFSRFLVPYLCDYQGLAIWCDGDMIIRTDLHEVFSNVPFGTDKAVFVVKHDYEPKEGTKFLGNLQSTYDKKNWSSVMVFNNEKCKALTLERVNNASGLHLHQFKWLKDDSLIGELPPDWNHLVGEYPEDSDAKLVHFTNGSPCFSRYKDCEYSREWHEELDNVLNFAVLDEVETKDDLYYGLEEGHRG